MPLLPPKFYELGNVPQLFFFLIVLTFGLAFKSFKEFGVRQIRTQQKIVSYSHMPLLILHWWVFIHGSRLSLRMFILCYFVKCLFFCVLWGFKLVGEGRCIKIPQVAWRPMCGLWRTFFQVWFYSSTQGMSSIFVVDLYHRRERKRRYMKIWREWTREREKEGEREQFEDLVWRNKGVLQDLSRIIEIKIRNEGRKNGGRKRKRNRERKIKREGEKMSEKETFDASTWWDCEKKGMKIW